MLEKERQLVSNHRRYPVYRIPTLLSGSYHTARQRVPFTWWLHLQFVEIRWNSAKYFEASDVCAATGGRGARAMLYSTAARRA